MAGSSDGGAHLLSFVGADYTTRLLSRVGARGADARGRRSRGSRRCPATVHGLRDRGVIRAGAARRPRAVRPDRACASARRAWCATSPPTAPRFVVDAEGYVAVIVNGEVLLENGRYTGALPGHVVRGT